MIQRSIKKSMFRKDQVVARYMLYRRNPEIPAHGSLEDWWIDMNRDLTIGNTIRKTAIHRDLWLHYNIYLKT